MIFFLAFSRCFYIVFGSRLYICSRSLIKVETFLYPLASQMMKVAVLVTLLSGKRTKGNFLVRYSRLSRERGNFMYGLSEKKWNRIYTTTNTQLKKWGFFLKIWVLLFSGHTVWKIKSRHILWLKFRLFLSNDTRIKANRVYLTFLHYWHFC